MAIIVILACSSCEHCTTVYKPNRVCGLSHAGPLPPVMPSLHKEAPEFITFESPSPSILSGSSRWASAVVPPPILRESDAGQEAHDDANAKKARADEAKAVIPESEFMHESDVAEGLCMEVALPHVDVINSAVLADFSHEGHDGKESIECKSDELVVHEAVDREAKRCFNGDNGAVRRCVAPKQDVYQNHVDDIQCIHHQQWNSHHENMYNPEEVPEGKRMEVLLPLMSSMLDSGTLGDKHRCASCVNEFVKLHRVVKHDFEDAVMVAVGKHWLLSGRQPDDVRAIFCEYHDVIFCS